MTTRFIAEKLIMAFNGFDNVFLHNYLYNECILLIIQPDNGHRNDGNMLVKNKNMRLNIFIRVHL
jgi:hypothetical protein